MNRQRLIAWRISTLFLLLAGTATCLADEPVKFSDVKSILSDRCFQCHGPDEGTRKAGLRLDIADELANVVEAGDVESSELFLRIASDDDSEIMPPPESKLELTVKEIDLVKRWIEQGAKWEQHWSFVKPEKTEPPKAADSNWPANTIDNFVLAKMTTAGAKPAPQVAKAKLLRRVSFDLTGLPPTLNELDEFLADSSEQAFEKAIDRLLASKRYGERMASDWLDIARYSDTYGYQVDRDRFVWPWRDWVIRAFNKNMPYDQFVTEQLAGDLLPNATDDQILATTFNRLHPQKVEGGSVEEEFRVEYVADRSQTAGMAFMGLTVECARCHDHKFDPLSQKEYYQLFAFFNNVDEAGLYSFFDASAVPSPSLLLMSDAEKVELSKLRGEVTNAEQKLTKQLKTRGAEFEKWLQTLGREGISIEPKPDFAADFEKTKNAKNRIVDAAIEFTGDDEIRLEAGDFKRHQPFSIASRLWVPDDKQLLKRAVIYHRSRAWTDSASRGYQLLIKNGKLSASLIHFWPGNAISVESVEPVPTKKWFHVTFSYDGSSRADGIQLFVDGKPIKTIVVKDSLQKQITGSGTSHLILGARFRDVGFKNGKLADLKLFHRQLASLEIAELHRKGGDDTDLKSKAPDQLLDLYQSRFDEDTARLRTEIAAARLRVNQKVDQTKEIMVMQETPENRPAFVLDRGAYDAPKGEVKPGTPAVFPPMPQGAKANRLGLAQWLTSPDHPLTSRVAVNHYWQLMFGEGLVRTPEDFGSQGQTSTHPQLLDWLAVEFLESGWNIKRLLKLIAMSKTYQQSTAANQELLIQDPDNRLLARASTYRLPAEMIRDNVLDTSGLLVSKIGGAPVRPYELEKSFQPSKPDNGEGLYRRSLYTFWKRTGPAPVMLTLDAAKRDVCQVKRERTSSPLAALVQLNNPQTVEASRKLAERLVTQHPGENTKVGFDLFRILTSRKPNSKEQEIVESLFESQLEYFSNNKSAAKEFLAVGKSKTNSDSPAVVAAWASVANTLYSFDECVMKR